MDLGAVLAAPAPVLVKASMAAAGNADDLLQDAQVLAEAGRTARAYSLAALAVEEAGKAGSLCLLAVMPQDLKAQAPVGRMLEWHQLKQVVGLFVGGVSSGFAVGPRLAVMPAAELEQLLGALDQPADEADRLKRHGLYVDVDAVAGAGIREPSEITEAEVISQLASAEHVISEIGTLLRPETPARLARPPAEAVELARAAVSALVRTRNARTPKAAVDVMANMVSKFRERVSAEDVAGQALLD